MSAWKQFSILEAWHPLLIFFSNNSCSFRLPRFFLQPKRSRQKISNKHPFFFKAVSRGGVIVSAHSQWHFRGYGICIGIQQLPFFVMGLMAKTTGTNSACNICLWPLAIYFSHIFPQIRSLFPGPVLSLHELDCRSAPLRQMAFSCPGW